MSLSQMSLRNFRCFTSYTCELHPQLTLLIGANGSGKTSLLEAIQVAASLRSFRTASLRDLIAQGAEAFSIKATVTKECTGTDMVHVAYGMTGGAPARIAEINGVGPVSRIELLQAIPVVTVTEYDMNLVQGGPLYRRAFLDYTIALQLPGYAHTLKQLSELISQRNALLAQERSWNRDMYYILSERLWRLTAQIRAERHICMQRLEMALQRLFREVLGFDDLRLIYSATPALSEEEASSSSLWCQQQEARERRYRRSLYGAHLDDMEWQVQGVSARRFASRGMQKLLVVLARSVQAAVLPDATLLLDDLMADFDEARLEQVMQSLLTSKRQLIITIPHATGADREAHALLRLLERHEQLRYTL